MCEICFACHPPEYFGIFLIGLPELTFHLILGIKTLNDTQPRKSLLQDREHPPESLLAFEGGAPECPADTRDEPSADREQKECKQSKLRTDDDEVCNKNNYGKRI